jgi:hypothetical protein
MYQWTGGRVCGTPQARYGSDLRTVGKRSPSAAYFSPGFGSNGAGFNSFGNSAFEVST